MATMTGIGVLLALIVMARPWSAAAAPVSVALQPFSAVTICTPFGVLITPGPFQISLDADQSVKNAVTTSISNAGVLTIGTSEDFQTQQPVKLTVRLPATALKSVTVNAPVSSQVAVNAGFTPGASFAATLSGSGDLLLLGLNATAITLTNSGASTLVAKGSYETVTVTTSGAGATFITGGTIGRVTASSSGVGRIVIDPTNASAQITASTQLLGKVTFTRGTCNLTGSNIPGVTNNPAAAAVSQLLGSNPFGALGGTCQQVATAGLPPLTPMWTCGLQVQGVFDCSASSFSGSASSSGGGGNTIVTNNVNGQTSTSTSGNGAAFAAVPGGGQVQFAQSTGPGQSTITATGAVQTIPCAASVPAASLNMI